MEVERLADTMEGTTLSTVRKWASDFQLAIIGSFIARVDEHYFNRALSSIDDAQYPIRNEAACRAYLQELLIGAALLPRVEVHNALGRSDMEVEVGRRHWVFEFKFAERDEQTQRLLAEGLAQVRSRRYGENPTAKERIRVVLVFSAQARRFTAWQTV